MAWATGIWLIALCYEMVLKYIVKVDDPPSWIGVVHGWVYFVYLLASVQPGREGALADRQDHRRAAGGHHPVARHHRRALPDQAAQGHP